MKRTSWAIITVLLLVVAAQSQKVTVTVQCAKADQEHSIPAGDTPGHIYSLSHTTCTYTKPGTLAGLQTKSGADTIFSEIKGNRVEWHGMYVETYSNGDQLFYEHHGNGTLKNTAFESGDDYYEVTGSTGKLKGYVGNGSCKIKGAADGTAVDECSGEFRTRK
ncbi:MAG: hypothetical protein ACXVZR_05265 [Terriglobales bacterium]